jgi:hypothetical protein
MLDALMMPTCILEAPRQMPSECRRLVSQAGLCYRHGRRRGAARRPVALHADRDGLSGVAAYTGTLAALTVLDASVPTTM